LESGAFSTPEEVIERALEFLSLEEDWLAEHRDEIAAKHPRRLGRGPTGRVNRGRSRALRHAAVQSRLDSATPLGMSLYRLTSKAKSDLRSVWSYIAADNVEAADRVEAAIYDAYAQLAEGPLRGHVRTDLTKLPVRFWTVMRFPNYVVVYDPATNPLKIIRVLHGQAHRAAAKELTSQILRPSLKPQRSKTHDTLRVDLPLMIIEQFALRSGHHFHERVERRRPAPFQIVMPVLH
jgi:plasmid stabilization system protein ParE